MTATGSSLLDFILRLLGDPQAQEEFRDNPQQVLQQHGFDGLCAQDVHDALPLVADTVQGTTPATGDPQVLQQAPPATALPGESHLDAAIRQLQYVTNNYSYADSHNTTVDSSVHQNIWADGDVHQSFDNHATTVSTETDVTGNGNAVGSGDTASNGNEVHNGDGATNFGNGSLDDNSTHATVGGFGSGNVDVTGSGATSTQSDSHNSSDSHDSSTVESNDTSVDSHNVSTTDSHDGGIPSHDTDSHETDSHDTDSHGVQGDSQHGLINVDHVLSDDNVNVDLLHGVHL